jgi:aspartyl aminopeptidase
MHSVDKDGQASATASAPAPRLGTAFTANHHSVLIERVAQELGVSADAVVDFELCLYDTQPAQRAGLYREFVSARALDNLLMSFICTEALVAASDKETLAGASQVFVAALFDNEEVGSGSMMGAGSNLLNRILTRINGDDGKTYDAAVARSILVSADMAHALHPNYISKHEDNHRVAIQRGLVIKENANMRYATNPITMFHVSELAKKLDIPLQQFCVRNDVGCGSTIGPILAAACGMRTIDVGVPQWAMHSVRETCGVEDVESALKLLTHYYPSFWESDNKLKVDEQ